MAPERSARAPARADLDLLHPGPNDQPGTMRARNRLSLASHELADTLPTQKFAAGVLSIEPLS